ncbi:MAG TPA: hypothetical protein VFV79_05170 [Saprospiraceae bacterium]|nr:hypothetical protein [Saprospiraceae bacterium]
MKSRLRWMNIQIFMYSMIVMHSGCTNNTGVSKIEPAYQWEKLADFGPWTKSYNYQMMAFQDTLWVFHPEGIWFTTDAKRWTLSTLKNVIGNTAFLDYVFFQNKIFGLGHFDGNIEKYTFRPTIYFSSDRMHWDSIENTNLQKRYFYHPVVFDEKLWIIGGEQDNTIWADIIQSSDGIHWQIVKDHLPFGPVINSQFLVYKDKLWMFNDNVWVSDNGLDWKEVTASIITGQEIFGYAPVVFDEQMWLIACNRSGQFASQVIYSADGLNWTPQTAPWSPRGGVAASVFKNAIIMTGGKFGGTAQSPEFGYSNDIWEMVKVEAKEEVEVRK